MPRNGGGHIRLTGKESDEKDEIIAGKSFQVRYLGSSDIQSVNGKGKGCTNEAVREIYSRYSTKNSFKNLGKRELFVSANCVSLYAPTEHAVIFRYQTINVTFCNTSEENRNAFAFVVKEPKNKSFRAHVVHCDNPAQANDVCLSMNDAFKVRSALYNAKQVDRAGWIMNHDAVDTTTKKSGLVERRKEGEKRISATATSVNGVDNVEKHNSRKDFGEFACAVLLPPRETHICNESVDENNCEGASFAGKPKGGSFSLAKILLGNNARHRSQSLPFASTNGGEWGCFQTCEDDDDFSLLARERSSSMKLLTAE